MVRLAIKTPDQKVLLVTPMASQFFKKDENCRRLLTNAIMSHQVKDVFFKSSLEDFIFICVSQKLLQPFESSTIQHPLDICIDLHSQIHYPFVHVIRHKC